ncbi:MAG: zinc ribbon domain-containing protein [Firmicutes bacterium]|nr:zinc ribbon domain-containing protein [Bacillota bacterium]
MPYYSFVCRECGKEFEAKVAVADKDKVKCPSCEAGNPRQIFTSVGMVMKSSGGDAGGSSCDTCQNRQFG